MENATSFKRGRSGNPSGGRKDGQKRLNRSTLLTVEQRRELAQRAGITPLQFLMSVMLDDNEEMSLRLEAAKTAAPYFHRKQPVDVHASHSGSVEHQVKFDLTQLDKLSDAELDAAIVVAQKLNAISAQAKATVEEAARVTGADGDGN